MQWVFQKWAPSSFDDREVVAHLSSTSRPNDFVQFLGRCRGNQVTRAPASPLLCGAIARAWYNLARAEDLTEYLLLQEKVQYLVAPTTTSNDQTTASTNRSAVSISIHILDGLEAETTRTLETWESIAAEKPQSLLPAMFTPVLGLIIVNAAITCQPDERASRRTESLRKKGEALTKTVTTVLSRPECEIEKVDVALNVVADYLPVLSEEVDAATFPDDLTALCVHLTNALQRRHQGKTTATISQDDMDLDVGFESQHSEVAEAAPPESTHRDLISLSTDHISFRRQVIAQVIKLPINWLKRSFHPNVFCLMMALSTQFWQTSVLTSQRHT